MQCFPSSEYSPSFPPELICCPKQFLPVTSHLAVAFPAFSPLEIGPVTTHFTSALLPSFLKLFQSPFLRCLLGPDHVKVNEVGFC